MRRYLNSRVLKRNIRQGLLSVAAALGLLFLFVNAQPVDSDLHYELVNNLRELQARDAELGEAVLQHHYQLFHNYDAVVAIMKRMQELASAIQLNQEEGVLPDTPQVLRELTVMRQQVEKKAAALEQFKSDNAVSKTALIYLPRTVGAVLDGLPRMESLHHEEFELLLRDALLMEVNQNGRANETLEGDIALIDRLIPRLSPYVREPAKLASKHAKSILENEKGMPGLLAILSSHGRSHIGADLEQIYMEHYRGQQHAATIYRVLLLLAAMAMLGYAIYAYYRAREKAQQLRIAAAAFETQESIIIIDPGRRIQRVNSSFMKLTGYSPEEVIGKTPDLLKSGRHDEEFFRKRWNTIMREGHWEGEIWNRRKDGTIHPVWLTTTAVTDTDGEVTHYVSVLTDITQRKEAEEQIHQLAFYDPLTKLPNRRLLIDRLNHSMVSGNRSIDHGAILFIDLDNFKTINDTKGHDVGDMLLIETARRLQTCVRGGDTVSRLGGDEFIVMLEGLGSEVAQAAGQARMAGEKIRESLSQPYWLGDEEYHSSCSIGISLFRAQDVAVDELLKRADTAMYEAKAAGRNTIRFFDPSMQAALEERARMELDLRHAISQREFLAYYQMQVNADGQPIGAEVLLRWMHPSRGLVMPVEFVHLAEENGLILPIGQWVLESACAQIKAWESNPRASGLQLAVNVSARQFHQPGFVELVGGIIKNTGINPARLKIELTESVVLDDIADTADKMHELKRIGIGFSLDDFGTGYSSLAYLTLLPIDQLKIDQSFVRNIGAKSTDAAIVQTIIGMANNLGIEVIAEGVETEAQRSFLERSGCLAFQGYLFSLPVPLDEFEQDVLSRDIPVRG